MHLLHNRLLDADRSMHELIGIGILDGSHHLAEEVALDFELGTMRDADEDIAIFSNVTVGHNDVLKQAATDIADAIAPVMADAIVVKPSPDVVAMDSIVQVVVVHLFASNHVVFLIFI